MSSLEPELNQSVVYVSSCDWGPCIEKIVVNTSGTILPNRVRAEDFKVSQILYPKDSNIGVTKSTLSVTDAFTSDSKGNKISTHSNYITILTDVHPEAENSSPFVSFALSTRFSPFYGYKISNSELNISISKVKGYVNADVAKFSHSKYEYTLSNEDEEESVTLNYSFYIPESEGKKFPLILWFHGMGESGTNPYQVLLGTKLTSLATEKIQSYFEDGCAILAPQCPTGWLESTKKSSLGVRYWTPVDKDSVKNKIKKPVKNFLNKIFVNDTPEEEKTPFAAVSFYTEPVKKLLYTFLAEHPKIDRNRIYVGGCSAGGYMTVNMLLESPELFAAAFPICEFYLDSKITSSQIKNLSEKPIWFVFAENDETVNPEKNSSPTIKRLRENGAKNLHSSVFRNVVDLSGKYLLDRSAEPDDDEYGLPYEYSGHYSWIYVLNDECEENGVSLFKWLSEQKLK